MRDSSPKKEIPFLSSNAFHRALIVSISLFFVAFLVIFLPFGVNEPRKEINLRFVAQMSMFGGVIFLTLLANEWLIRRRWLPAMTFRQFLLWFAWMVFSSGSMNFLLYNYLQDWYDMHWGSYALHVVNVGTVEIFPVAAVFYFFRHKDLRRRIDSLQEAGKTLDILSSPVTLAGSGERERLTLEIGQVLFLESDDNYVVLHYLEKDQPVKRVFRSTLTAMEKAPYPVPFLLRIHRSFLVNVFLVQSIRGNVQRSELKLRPLERQFPVSRNYVHDVRSRLTQLQGG